MACAWAGFAGYATAMLLSYFVGQKYYPIRYNLKEIGLYVLMAGILFVLMTLCRSFLPAVVTFLANTLLLLLFVAYIVRKDFPLSSLPVIGKKFRK